MLRIEKREFTVVLAVGAAIAILYRYWLLAPVLKYLTAVQWWLVAILVAMLIGVASAILRLRLYILAGSVSQRCSSGEYGQNFGFRLIGLTRSSRHSSRICSAEGFPFAVSFAHFINV
jgi:hypothetical protein